MQYFAMHINELADDCLLKIFNFLNPIERIQNELVCKRWRYLLPLIFADIQQLDVADFLTRTFKKQYQSDTIHFAPTVIGLLQRCGPFLRKISFGSRWLKVSQPIIDIIKEKCGKLTCLDLGCVILHADIRPTLKQLAPQLTEFLLNETHWTQEGDSNDIGKLFPTMRKLRSLNLKRAPFNLDYINELPETLHTINLGGARQLSLEILENFLITHTNLRQMYLSNVQKIENHTIEIIGAIKSLRVLEFSHINRDDLDLSPIANLKHTLEELHLQCNNSLNDLAFSRICNECKNLRLLNLCGCKKLRDFGALAYCETLKKLLVSNTTQICDEDLIDLANNRYLESLTITQCANVGSIGILAIAQQCPLREIYVAQCNTVDDAALLGLVNNHLPIPMISLQNCHLTNEGVAALGQLDSSVLAGILELDISYNRSINDASIMAIYHAISIYRMKQDKLENPTTTMSRPIIYVHQTAVSKNLAPLIDSYIKLVF